MSKTITILTLGLQIALTFTATFCIYMVFALLDSDFGFDGLFGLVIFQPIIAIILSGLTIFVCLIVGLPIRLHNKLNSWWTTNFYVSLIGTFIGLTFLVLALLPNFSETVTHDLNGEPTLKQIPNSLFSITGWLLTAFSVLHIYPPRQLTERAKDFFQKAFKVSLVVIASLTITSCNSSSKTTEKPTLLRADREAPLGWMSLRIYNDSTFNLTSHGLRKQYSKEYLGKVIITKDTLYFNYNDSIPKAGSTAVYNDKVVGFIDGEYPERLEIRMTKLADNE
ncbi:hypothetical protein [Schleiferia thermophila]|uniref:Uncharacterized protein n=1 Tax=Schleiferia thermophila TaxID=884107 RepID=A0A369AAS9_9FLAO|nr:hypothetical protein [Schleiferia thermophila]RCX05508.1 hypothetical protein DES35_101795 [Schleiferia thermophila]GCD78995.1 hypothetical protein JCM30197_02420 [Schleiferia thermophila]